MFSSIQRQVQVWVGWALLACIGMALLVVGCEPGGENSRLSPQLTPSPQLEEQAIMQVLDLYRTAIIQEDVDRLETLLQTAAAQIQAMAPEPRQLQTRADDGALLDARQFLEMMITTFRTRAVLDLHLPEDYIRIAADRRSVTFLELESTLNPVTLEQLTQVFQTTFELTQQEVEGGFALRITTVRRDGPLFQVRTPGQVVGGVLALVEVRQLSGTFPLVAVEVEVPETGARQALEEVEGVFRGSFTPAAQPDPAPLQVLLHGSNGERLILRHRYRLRVPGEGTVQKIAGIGATARFFAVAIAADGTVWSGGVEPAFGRGGTLYRVPSGSTTAVFVADLVADPAGRVEDLGFDTLGRLHTIIFAPQQSGDIILDQGVFCQTVNAFDPAYPFQILDLESSELQPSASTRVVAAGERNIWLFGTDAGVAQVADGFRDGQCPQGVEVSYDPIFTRQPGGLVSNTVPALVVGRDGILWFGTAFGLVRLQNGQFTPVPFDPELSLQGNPETLEEFFQAVAAAIFTAQPLSTVRIGAISFLDEFGSPLVKEDLIFGMVEDGQGRLWAGTLGGGIRRIETQGPTLRETLHLTRQDSLSSNIIFALAEGPDGSIWAATEEGVTRIREIGDEITVTNFSALDGLALPVRDVAVDATGVVWLATDGGLFRIILQ